jgi:hypothetical protein
MSDLDNISKELNLLKDTQKLAKDTAKIVTDIQSDNNDAVKQAQKKREIEKKSKERMLLNAELQAFEKFQAEQERKEMLQKMEKDVINKYGKEAWQRVQQLREEINKSNEEEMKLVQKDKDKVNDLFWWILGIVSILVYLFKGYKI